MIVSWTRRSSSGSSGILTLGRLADVGVGGNISSSDSDPESVSVSMTLDSYVVVSMAG